MCFHRIAHFRNNARSLQNCILDETHMVAVTNKIKENICMIWWILIYHVAIVLCRRDKSFYTFGCETCVHSGYIFCKIYTVWNGSLLYLSIVNSPVTKNPQYCASLNIVCSFSIYNVCSF